MAIARRRYMKLGGAPARLHGFHDLLDIWLDGQGETGRLALVRRRSRPIEKPSTEVTLKMPDCDGQRWLRNAAEFCCASETLFLAEDEEVAKGLEFHLLGTCISNDEA
jgi:hypothetical protein